MFVSKIQGYVPTHRRVPETIAGYRRCLAHRQMVFEIEIRIISTKTI
jgi:hypothetical protein